MTATQRRTNGRAANCKACGAFCEAGTGFLHFDRKSRSGHSGPARGWFVKCGTCTSGGETRGSLKCKAVAAARRANPAPRPWSVTQVKGWAVTGATRDDGPEVIVSGRDFEEVVTQRDYRGWLYQTCDLAEAVIAGRPLSPAAADHLAARISPLAAAAFAAEQAPKAAWLAANYPQR